MNIVLPYNFKQQAARNRKFDMWFRGHAEKGLEKFDTHFIIESLEIYASLILHTDNSYKDELVKVFQNQANEYDKG